MLRAQVPLTIIMSANPLGSANYSIISLLLQVILHVPYTSSFCSLLSKSHPVIHTLWQTNFRQTFTTSGRWDSRACHSTGNYKYYSGLVRFVKDKISRQAKKYCSERMELPNGDMRGNLAQKIFLQISLFLGPPITARPVCDEFELLRADLYGILSMVFARKPS